MSCLGHLQSFRTKGLNILDVLIWKFNRGFAYVEGDMAKENLPCPVMWHQKIGGPGHVTKIQLKNDYWALSQRTCGGLGEV
jgi:hypothetical protein